MSSSHKDVLFQAAKKAMAKFYAPYSDFPVGAAILSESGNIHSGCNIENAAYPQSACAEANAIAHLIMAGDRKILEIAVIAEKQDLITPCGGCRQRLSEFSTANTLVHLCDANGVADTVTLGDLLPRAFDGEAL
ncbi:MAG: cytidine deaminase [Hyphomicrobiales bacterium]